MRKKRIKTAVSIAAICMILLNAKDVKAVALVKDETAVAGMSKLLEDYYTERLSESGISIANITTPIYINGERLAPVNVGVSPFEGYAFSNTEEFVNIRSKASAESKLVGKLYRASVATVIKQGKEWTKIRSGNVEGYIKSEYLLFGAEAEKLAEESSVIYAMATCVTLNVRMGQGIEHKILTQVAEGEKFEVKEIYNDWFEIILDMDDNTGEAITGFISKDYADLEYTFKEAVSIEEEEAKIAAAEEARRAEQERLQQLQQQQSQVSRPSGGSSSNSSSSSNSGSSSSNNTNSSSSSNSGSGTSSSGGSSAGTVIGRQIAEYAVKFVGNPYQWGGTSLTNGADCSGFVYALYKHYGYTLPRVSRDQARSAGTKVSASVSNLQPGDLLYYGDSTGYVNHVAMYIGNGKVVHASNYREGIKISTWNYRTPITARRVLN